MFSVTKLQTRFRKDMIDKNDSRRSKATDSLMNFETVKYFNAEEYEMKRYKEGIRESQTSLKTLFNSNLCLGYAKCFINNSGHLTGSLLAASQVVNQDKTIGKKYLYVHHFD